MEDKKNILIIYGGGGSEHDISKKSAEYFKEKVLSIGHTPLLAELNKNNELLYQKEIVEFKKKHIYTSATETFVDFAIPCIHGEPGENGEIQYLLKYNNISFLGSKHEASILCFNKISTKLWLEKLNIPVVDYFFSYALDKETLDKAYNYFSKWGALFIKASLQGSSIGCFLVKDKEKIKSKLKEAFEYSPYVLIEKPLENIRELEVSVFEYNSQVKVSTPGEILCDSKLYTFEEKYSDSSSATTKIKADLTDDQNKLIQEYALKAFKLLKLRHLCRADFFLANNKIYLNEINTMPGHTNISMFPTMLEASGITYEDFLTNIISNT